MTSYAGDVCLQTPGDVCLQTDQSDWSVQPVENLIFNFVALSNFIIQVSLSLIDNSTQTGKFYFQVARTPDDAVQSTVVLISLANPLFNLIPSIPSITSNCTELGSV
jgi:hypothetical protein